MERATGRPTGAWQQVSILRPIQGQHPLFLAIDFDIQCKKNGEPSDLARYLCSIMEPSDAADPFGEDARGQLRMQ